MIPRSPLIRLLVLLVALVALVGAACGNDDAGPRGEATDADESAATTTTAAGDDAGDTGTEVAASRIVSISPTATETLFAIGAGDQVIAVDSLSTYPPDAPVTDLQAFEPNIEAVAELDPDLVVLSFDPGDVVAGLEAIGVETLVQPSATSLDDAYAQIEQLGVATGHVAEAAELVMSMQTELDGMVAAQPDRETPLTFFHEVDNTLYTATSATFIGELYAMVGLENVADAADDGTGFPQLSPEYVIDADPDLVFLADAAYGESAETVAARPGWDTMTAVQQGRVFPVDPDLASRWGPRILDFVQTISDAVAAVEEPADA